MFQQQEESVHNNCLELHRQFKSIKIITEQVSKDARAAFLLSVFLAFTLFCFQIQLNFGSLDCALNMPRVTMKLAKVTNSFVFSCLSVCLLIKQNQIKQAERKHKNYERSNILCVTE